MGSKQSNGLYVLIARDSISISPWRWSLAFIFQFSILCFLCFSDTSVLYCLYWCCYWWSVIPLSVCLYYYQQLLSIFCLRFIILYYIILDMQPWKSYRESYRGISKQADLSPWVIFILQTPEPCPTPHLPTTSLLFLSLSLWLPFIPMCGVLEPPGWLGIHSLLPEALGLQVHSKTYCTVSTRANKTQLAQDSFTDSRLKYMGISPEIAAHVNHSARRPLMYTQ